MGIAKKQKACRWHVYRPIFSSKMSTWHIRSFVNVSSNVLWLVPYNFVFVSAQVLNNVKQKVCISAKTNWSCFNNVVSITSSVNWNTMKHSSCSLITTWSVGYIVVRLSSSWNTIRTVKKTTNVLFCTRLTTFKKNVTIWNQYNTLWFQRFLRYKIFKSVLSYIIPKGVHQPGKLRGAYVPNATITVLDKKRRFKLRIK